MNEQQAKQSIKEALVYLASRCDGAILEDKVGFNGRDSSFGKSLARQINNGSDLSPKQYATALKMLKTYRDSQLSFMKLPPNGFTFTANPSKETFKQCRVVGLMGDFLTISFDYEKEIVDAVKTIEGRRYVEAYKFWSVPVANLGDVITTLEPFGFDYNQSVLDIIETLKAEERLLKEEYLEKQEWMEDFIETDSWSWNFVPYSHQWHSVKFFSEQTNNRCLISDQPGLGKTKSALMAAKSGMAWHDYQTGETPVLIVISPVSLKQNWLKEASELGMSLEIYSYAKTPLPFNKPYFLIADEAHAYQNIKSQRTQKFLNLCSHENCIGVIALTATPMLNGRPANLYPILKAIGHPIADNKSKFEKRYCDAKATAFTSWDTTGATNLEELNQLISSKVLRRLKSECLDLPEKSIIEIECEHIKEIEDEFQFRLKTEKSLYEMAVNSGEKSEKGKALVMMGLNRRLSSLYKVTEAIKMAEEILSNGEQVVIFTEFVESAEKLANHFGVQALTGDTKQEITIDGQKIHPRQQMVDDFQNGLNRVFVGTHKAGGVGITLTSSSYMIIVDLPWTPGALEQTTDRVHRIGTKKNVTIYQLFAKDIDWLVAAKLGQKSSNIDKVLKKMKVKPENLAKMSIEEIATKLFS